MESDQKRLFLAVGLSAVVLMVWKFYFDPIVENTSPVEVRRELNKSNVSEKISNNSSTENASTQIDQDQETKVSSAVLMNKNVKLVINSKLEISDFENPQSVFPFKEIVGEKKTNAIYLLSDNGSKTEWNFLFQKISENKIEGTDSKHSIKFNGELLENGKFLIHLESSQPKRYQFRLKSLKEELENRQTRQYVYFSKDVERFAVTDDSTGDDSVKWFGIDFNYHLFAFVFNEKKMSRFASSENGEFLISLIQPEKSLDGYFVFTKKNYDSLSKFGDKLDLSVDFGVFGIIAVPMLRALQFFYRYIPNYGIAIILLTLLVRLVTFPLQFKSFKSMKKMQKIQPELTKLREKFKDDPQRMQRETMELFKRAGANPLGGCFPLLLQMPVFFAFYQVLSNAIELVGAPFLLWITDLSIKDPYYVLPVLMSIAMFFQSKLNPSATADPNQKKLMYFMPIIFFFIMKNLPAGLNLYIFVSTIFGIAQQLIVYKTTD